MNYSVWMFYRWRFKNKDSHVHQNTDGRIFVREEFSGDYNIFDFNNDEVICEDDIFCCDYDYDEEQNYYEEFDLDFV